MTWRMSRLTLIVLILAVLSLGMGVVAVRAQDAMKMGESVFTDATPTLLADGAVAAWPAEAAGIALQRVHIAPGGHIDTPAEDPRLVLLTVEQGTITVRNTVDATVTRQAGEQETVPAETEYTMTVGDSYLSPANSGGYLRNPGTGEAILLAAIVYPASEATPIP
ncbi:MAG: hypothetical protein ABWZ77_01140 [Naasia sp.]